MINWIKANLSTIIPALISLVGVLINTGLIVFNNSKIRKYYDLENKERTNNIIHRLILRYLNDEFPQKKEICFSIFFKSVKKLAKNHGYTFTKKQVLQALSDDIDEKPLKVDFINKKIKRNYMTNAELANAFKKYAPINDSLNNI